MEARRPKIQEGYLGPQTNWKQLGLVAESHPEPEITTKNNHLEVKIQTKSPTKFTHTLINCRTNFDISKYVFLQMKDGVATFLVHMPTVDYYKLQIYALPADDERKSHPNVYNYLIHCTHALQSVHPFPKVFLPWTQGCFLYEPLTLHLSSKLMNMDWHVEVPESNGVAVVCNGEWHHFENTGGSNWKGHFSLERHRMKGMKVALSANLKGGEENKYAALLEYTLE